MGGEHGSGAAIPRKPPLRVGRLQPSLVYVTKRVRYVVGEEGLDALLSQVGRTERSRPRTDRHVCQLKPRLAVAEPTIVAVASLEVANQVLASRGVVSVMAKGCHTLRRPVPAALNPTRIGGELFEITDQGLRQVSDAAVGGYDVALGYQDYFVVGADSVPAFGVHNSVIGNLEVTGKIFRFHQSPLWFESLTGRRLVVSGPSHIGTLVTYAEGSIAKYSV
mmetsp:Transcript_42804/g.100496  ORF Transcript_42804/g.100496 Transcript_42804/m.100496 type:complete len:221 (-) Transcript_42804:54-716(-)